MTTTTTTTISWDEAFKLVEEAVAVSVDSHSNELNYPFCLCDDAFEDNRIELDMNDDLHIVIDKSQNETVEVTQANGHLVFTDSSGELVELQLLVSKRAK